MSMAASLEILNNTGSMIMFTSIDQVNDDATWSAPSKGDKLQTGKSATISMGNSSVFFAPRGVGADVRFICAQNFEMGQIYFDDPAVGAHSFQFDQSGNFNYAVTNPTGNSYVVAVTLK
jgi:hypothetical protein